MINKIKITRIVIPAVVSANTDGSIPGASGGCPTIPKQMIKQLSNIVRFAESPRNIAVRGKFNFGILSDDLICCSKLTSLLKLEM